MADRIIAMREKLYDLLVELKTPGEWGHIKSQIGQLLAPLADLELFRFVFGQALTPQACFPSLVVSPLTLILRSFAREHTSPD